ncbi:MAG: cysteine desulfurase family protein [bacterium]|nr:cysteine desulfurase family protein [bacterium]
MDTKKIYLDYAATTPVSKEVLEAMTPYFSKYFGNASEPHQWGIEAKLGIEKARSQVAAALGAKEKEIVFTSCATESINLAHKGLVEGLGASGKGIGEKPHIITTSIEHKAVLETCKHLEKLGMAEVTYLPVDKDGLVNVVDVEKAIRPETVLVSIMFVNNEVGTIEPIQEIGQLVKRVKQLRITNNQFPIYFHTDATQAIQSQDCRVDKLGADLLSLTGHKFCAPKGIGALYVREGIKIKRQQDGGGQESNRRAGTENVPYIVGLGKAIEISKSQISNLKSQTEKLRDRLIESVLKIPGTQLTGHPIKRAPHIASFIIKGVEGESLLLLLNEHGIAVSTGSACNSGTLSPSHVLTAMGYPPELSHGSVRFSLGKDTTEEDIDYVCQILPEVVERLRQIAPDFSKTYGLK